MTVIMYILLILCCFIILIPDSPIWERVIALCAAAVVLGYLGG